MSIDGRVKLIAATRELLGERGYTATSPRDIQARSDVGQGSMYHHFSGKSELAAAALAESGDALLSAAAESFDSGGSVFDRLAHYLRRERPVLLGCPIGRMTEDAEVMASSDLRAPIERTLLQLQSRIAELIEEGRLSGEFTSTVASMRLAATITATVQGAYVLSKAAADERPFSDAIEGMIDLLRSQVASTDSPRTSRG